MSTILIKNVKIVRDNIKEADVFVRDGVISKIGRVDRNADITIDGTNKYLFYGFCDLHAHLGEPGYEENETISTGVRAAVRGGYTDVFCMPNTLPVCDNRVVAEYIVKKAKDEGFAHVHPVGAITKGTRGMFLADMADMKSAGVLAVSDGDSVSSGGMMRAGIEFADSVGLRVLSHCEDKTISRGGVANEGYNADSVGLKGISRAAEEAGVARELVLADALKIPVHLCDISTRGSVELIRFYKKKGVAVTAETCPHYFALSDECVRGLDTNTKVNPPLRDEDDRTAIIEGIMDGTIDVIATGHDPQSTEGKNTDYDSAKFGISGIETAFSVTYTTLVRSGVIDMVTLGKLMSTRPREIVGLQGKIREDERANLTLVDIDRSYIVDSREFASKGKNTPFNGSRVFGKVTDVIVDGKIRLCNSRLVEPTADEE